MPNRILKESICTSDNIDRLSAFHETVFYRLIVNCDDFGRFDARPKILAARLFPLKDIRTAQIEDALRALTSAELVTLYTVGGKPFLQMNSWAKHQQIRNMKSKFPSPDEADAGCGNLISIDIKRMQSQSDASKCPRNPIQSESESNPNPNLSSERTIGATEEEHETPSDFNIILNDKTYYNVPLEDIERFKGLYPNVDVEQALRNMIGWSEATATKRKTRAGIKRFITGWLTREQDKGGNTNGKNGVSARFDHRNAQPKRIGTELIV